MHHLNFYLLEYQGQRQLIPGLPFEILFILWGDIFPPQSPGPLLQNPVFQDKAKDYVVSNGYDLEAMSMEELVAGELPHGW